MHPPRRLRRQKIVSMLSRPEFASTTKPNRTQPPSSAQAGDVGNLFQYAIATPVTLPRQQSAMLPIVNET